VILRQVWGSRLDSAGQSVWTELAPLSQLANVKLQAHRVKKRALIQQDLCEGPALAVTNV